MIINLFDLVGRKDNTFYDRGLSFMVFEKEFAFLRKAWEDYTIDMYPELASSISGFNCGKDYIVLKEGSSSIATRRVTDDRGKQLFRQTIQVVKEFGMITSLVQAGQTFAQKNKGTAVDILGFGYGDSPDVFDKRRSTIPVDEVAIKRFSFANRHLYSLLAEVRTRHLITGTLAENVVYDDKHVALSARAEDTQSVGYKSLFRK